MILSSHRLLSLFAGMALLAAAGCAQRSFDDLYRPAGAGAPYGFSEQRVGERRFVIAYDAPLATGAWSFIVAAATMLLVLAAALALSAGTPRPRAPSALPWWGWLGGFCGAAYVTSVFSMIPEIGVAPTVALTVAGQQLASVAVDRYGLLRLPRRPLSAARLGGVALLLAGVVLIQAG